MRKPIVIDRTLKTKTPVTEDILDMLAKLAKWKPTTLEQVIQVGERLIHAANEDLFYGSAKADTAGAKTFFESLVGKMLKYPNGIMGSTEYLYIDEVTFAECEWNMHAKLTGVRLSKHNRIGGDTIQVYTLPVHFNNIIARDDNSVTVSANGFHVKYEVVTKFKEYSDAYIRIREVIERANKIPSAWGKVVSKVSLTKKPFTKSPTKDDNKVEAKTKFNQRGKKWPTPPTSTTTSKATSKSCEVLSATTSFSPATMASGTGKSIRPKRVSVILARKSSKKSPPSSKSS